MLVALLIAKRAPIHIEPFRAETNEIPGWRRDRRGGATQHRTDPREQFAKLAWLGEIVVGANLKANHPIDRARSCRQHDDWNVGFLLEVADNGEAILLRHMKVEHDQVRPAPRDLGAKAGPAVTERYRESMHPQVVADHVAGCRFVVHHHDMPGAVHVAGIAILNVVPEGPVVSATTVPPCKSTIRFTIDNPRPVEVSPPVGLADRR